MVSRDSLTPAHIDTGSWGVGCVRVEIQVLPRVFGIIQPPCIDTRSILGRDHHDTLLSVTAAKVRIIHPSIGLLYTITGTLNDNTTCSVLTLVFHYNWDGLISVLSFIMTLFATTSISMTSLVRNMLNYPGDGCSSVTSSITQTKQYVRSYVTHTKECVLSTVYTTVGRRQEDAVSTKQLICAAGHLALRLFVWPVHLTLDLSRRVILQVDLGQGL